MDKQKVNWWNNPDGSLKCFGKPWEYSNEGQSFHCGQLIYKGECSELLKRHCWKLSTKGEVRNGHHL